MAIWLGHRQSAGSAEARAGAAGDIVRASEFGTLIAVDEACRQAAREREAILAAARAQAAEIVAGAQAEADEMRAAAQSEYDAAAGDGYRDGEQKAIADWLARVAQTGDARAGVHARMRERLASVVSVAVEKIVAVQHRDLLFERALAEVDRIADGAAYLNISVHPSDYPQAQAAFERLASRWRGLGQAFPISVLADARLAVGSCVAESDFGVVDAGLETQLEAMRGAVARAVQREAVRDIEDEDAERDTYDTHADADVAKVTS